MQDCIDHLEAKCKMHFATMTNESFLGNDSFLGNATFIENDYEGIVAFRNSLYPEHPKTLKMVRHNDKTHERKIKQKCFVFEHNGSIIVCAGYEQFLDDYHPNKFVIYIHVHQDHINKGYGSTSYKFIKEQLRQFDPIKITSMINEISTGGIRF